MCILFVALRLFTENREHCKEIFTPYLNSDLQGGRVKFSFLFYWRACVFFPLMNHFEFKVYNSILNS